MLTLLALLNAMSIPLVCGLGWCTPSAEVDCCSKSEAASEQGCHSDGAGCSKASCPFAHTGACTGLVYLHETDILPEVTMSVEPVIADFPAVYPAGFTFGLIRPPTASC